MLNKLGEAEKKYEAVGEKLSSESATSDMEEYRRLMKEYKLLTPIVEKYREYKRYVRDLEDTAELMESDDKEMKALAALEYEELKGKIEEAEQELKIMLLPRDPNDDKNVIIEIRAGAGGEEAALFSYVLYRMYNMYSDKMGYKTELISLNETGLGGFKEVSFSVDGEGAF